VCLMPPSEEHGSCHPWACCVTAHNQGSLLPLVHAAVAAVCHASEPHEYFCVTNSTSASQLSLKGCSNYSST
jgi:hypothetical protein